MKYLKKYKIFESSKFIELECGLLDIMTGKVINRDADQFYIDDYHEDYSAFDELSDNDKEIVKNYYKSVEELIKYDIDFDLIKAAKDLSLDFLDSNCQLVVKFYLKDTTKYIGYQPEYMLYKLRYSHDNYHEFYPRFFKEEWDKIESAKNRNKYTINGRAYYSYGIFIYNNKKRDQKKESDIINSLKESFPDYNISNNEMF